LHAPEIEAASNDTPNRQRPNRRLIGRFIGRVIDRDWARTARAYTRIPLVDRGTCGGLAINLFASTMHQSSIECPFAVVRRLR
jgi:hypothetical protein